MRTLIAVVLSLVPIMGHARCPSSVTGAFLEPGRYGVGVRTLPLVDQSRPTPAHGNVAEQPSRVLTTEVWYPTTGGSGAPVRDADAAKGRFPLILSSHGYGDIRTGEAYVAEALASRGYVVAAPDFPLTNLMSAPRDPVDVVNQPGDVRFVADQVLSLAKSKGSWLAGRIDRRRIGASGLSYGGLTTLLVTFHPTMRDRRIRAAAALAPAACALGPSFYRAARPPLLLMQGTEDLLVPLPSNAGRAYADARSPRELVALANASHTAFSGLISAPSTVNYDHAIGCAFVETEFAANFARLQTIADPANGIDPSGCALPCQGPVPSDVPMQAARQHDLTQATVVAFFESTFRKSHDGRCLLRSALATENADVSVQLHRRGK